jgi:3-oxoacyl-[acyl-carrier-protein] synthase III
MMEEGTWLLAHGETLAERVRGAERQLASLFHDHLAAVLLGHVSRRLDFREFITRMDMSGMLDGKYEKDVADELRHCYSDCPRS